MDRKTQARNNRGSVPKVGRRYGKKGQGKKDLAIWREKNAKSVMWRKAFSRRQGGSAFQKAKVNGAIKRKKRGGKIFEKGPQERSSHREKQAFFGIRGLPRKEA